MLTGLIDASNSRWENISLLCLKSSIESKLSEIFRISLQIRIRYTTACAQMFADWKVLWKVFENPHRNPTNQSLSRLSSCSCKLPKMPLMAAEKSENCKLWNMFSYSGIDPKTHRMVMDSVHIGHMGGWGWLVEMSRPTKLFYGLKGVKKNQKT